MRALSLAILLILNAALLLCPDVSVRGVAAGMLFLLPGLFLGLSVFRGVSDTPSRIVLQSGSGFAFALLFGYGLQALPGSVRPLDCLLALNLLAAFALLRVSGPLPRPTKHTMLLLLLVSTALVPRFLHLGAAEYQGDEARAILLAAAAQQGVDGILFTHKKGPAEVLFAAPPLFLSEGINEFGSRFLFGLAGSLSLVAVFAFTRRVSHSAAAGLAAAAVLWFDGFFFAFSRIVQYQSTLVFFLLCALLALKEEDEQGNNPAFLTWAALFSASALLCHYDALFAFPAFTLFAWLQLRTRGLSLSAVIRRLRFPLLQFIVVAAAFYAPFFLDNYFSSNTAGYLSQRLGADRLPVNNLPRYLSLRAFYGGAVETIAITAVLLVAFVRWGFAYLTRGSFLLSLAGLVWYVAVCVIDAPSLAEKSAFVAFAFFLAPLVLSRAFPAPHRLLTTWLFVTMLALGFFFARPNTHFYVAHAAGAMLLGLFAAEMLSSIRAPLWLSRTAVAVSAALLFVPSLTHLNRAFLQPGIEYRFAYPKVRPEGFLDIHGGKLPAGAFFGFQHRSGWKAVGELFAQGDLSGTFFSNEEDLITAWYTRGNGRAKPDPDYYIVATRPNDPVPISPSYIEAHYSFWGRIYVDGRRAMDIYSRIPREGTPQPYQLEDFTQAFDRHEITFDAQTALEQSVSR